ncbi:MAG TPA: DUF177 domain-containing protein [Polyangia bacterium]|jgi:uncharacterized protein|nr:DUF177 domain-containing protein [Polyangia bacterium]
MQYKIKDIGDDGLVLDVPVTADWLAAACPDSDLVPAQPPLRLHGVIERSGSARDADILLRGDLKGAIETPCSRCLETARIVLNIPLAVTFVEREPGDPEEADDPDVVYFDSDEVDIAPELRDEILLAIPLGPLCQDGCRGLCPLCGANRNLTACACQTQPDALALKQNAFAKIKL